MKQYKFKLRETLKPSEVDPSLIARINKQYGSIDMENDFFNDDLSTYFRTDKINDKTGSVSHKVIPLASFADSLKELSQAVKSLKGLTKTKEGGSDDTVKELALKLKEVFNRYRTHIRKNYPDQYQAIKDTLEEISSTGGGAGAASFTPGTGMQYATPNAFSGKKKGKYADGGMYTKKFGYKLVPNKIKDSGLEVKQLFEAETSKEYQDKRVKAFDLIEQELNNIYKILSNAKNETIRYYNENPGSYGVIKPTDLVLDYIKDIKDLLIDK